MSKHFKKAFKLHENNVFITYILYIYLLLKIYINSLQHSKNFFV